MNARKSRGRPSAASRVQLKSNSQDGRTVRFQANNGEVYHVDVVQMQQRNVATGNRRAVRRSGGKWFFSSFSRRQGATSESFMKQSWQAYTNHVQQDLEAAFRGSAAKLDKVHNTLCCAQGHPVVFDKRWKHECNLCGASSTAYRCADFCDYDLCKQCAVATEETTSRNGPKALISKAAHAISGSLSSKDASDTCKAFLTSNMGLPAVVQGLRGLCQDHALQFSVEDVRQIAITWGSVSLLRLVLCSEPQVQLLGMHIFDRRYPGLVVSDGVKACVRLLLSRGANLGRFAPASKLFRKVEADELEAWAQRYFTSMDRSCINLPDHAKQQILDFLI